MYYRHKETNELVLVEHNEVGNYQFSAETLNGKWYKRIKESELKNDYIDTEYSNIKPYDMFIIEEYYSPTPVEKSIFQKGKIYVALGINGSELSCTNNYNLRLDCFDIRIINFDAPSKKKINIDDRTYEIKFEKIVTPKYKFGHKFNILDGREAIIVGTHVENGWVTYDVIFENNSSKYTFSETDIDERVQ